MPKKPTPDVAFRHVYHAVYLQLSMGAVMATILASFAHAHDHDTRSALLSGGNGVLLIGLAINTLCYLRRFRKALVEWRGTDTLNPQIS